MLDSGVRELALTLRTEDLASQSNRPVDEETYRAIVAPTDAHARRQANRCRHDVYADSAEAGRQHVLLALELV